MKKKLIGMGLLCLVINGVYGQCYISHYDVLKEKLCLDNGKFFFELINPLYPNTKIEGDYITQGDTLVFNPGVMQNEVQVLRCESSKKKKADAKLLKFIDQNKKPLKSITIYSANHNYMTDKEGILRLKEELPEKISISITRLSGKLWPNPYQELRIKLHLNYRAKKKDNFLTVELNIPEEFKMSFECERKLLKRNDSLFYIRENGQVLDLCFKRDHSLIRETETIRLE